MKGDDESFGLLIHNKKQDLYKIAYSYVHNEQDALDIVGDSIYKAYISLKGLKQPEFFNTWLIRIVINTAINFINKSKKIIYLDDNVIDNLSHVESDVSDNMDLKEALKNLDPIYKSIIILRYFQNLKLKQIAEILEIPLSTVKTRLYRGIEILKIELGEDEDFEE